jgi:membrane protein
MPVYAGALAYRGLLVLVPMALLFVWLLGLFGLERSLPRLTAALLRLRASARDAEAATGALPLEGLLSIGVIVGVWSMGTGARLLVRALNAAHGVEETRRPVMLVAFSLVFLPALAVLTVLATVLLLLTSRTIAWSAGLVGLGAVVDFIGPWLRIPLAFGLLGLALSAVYRFGPSMPPPFRAVALGAAVAVTLWVVTSLAFSFAVSNVLDYGSTYGRLGAAVALLVYLNLSAMVLLFGAEVSAMMTGIPAGGVPPAAPGEDPPDRGGDRSRKPADR